MTRSMLTVLAVAMSAASCERTESVPMPPDPEEAIATAPAAADPAMERTSECVNREAGYVLRYPADWHVNGGEILGPCSLFDPEQIEIPRGSEVPVESALMIGLEPVPFTTLTGEVLGRRDLSRERTTVDGREAMRIEGETTGDGLYDRGIRSYQYFVDLGDTTMVATTYGVGSLPLDRKRRVLDAMMETLAFTRSDPSGRGEP